MRFAQLTPGTRVAWCDADGFVHEGIVQFRDVEADAIAYSVRTPDGMEWCVPARELVDGVSAGAAESAASRP